MAEYPRTVLEFRDWFADDAACRDYLAKLRWPEGFRCPICRGPDHWVTARGLRHCRGCGRQTSVTAGTLFADTHLPLRLWFEALWHVTSQKSGASALGLQRVLGLGSYRTAWNLLHKLRRAMVRPGRERLQGIVEVDEIFIGGPRPGKRGRGAQGKVLVVVAAQQAAKGIGRIRLTRVADASARSLEPAIAAAIEVRQPGTDGRLEGLQWAGPAGVSAPDRPLQRRGGREPVAIGQPGGVAVEAMAARHAPGSGQRRAPRLLLGRVHLPLQSPDIGIARPAVPAADPASRRSQPGPCERYPGRQAPGENQPVDRT